MYYSAIITFVIMPRDDPSETGCPCLMVGCHISKESTSPQVDATYYRSLVGSLRYLVNIRLDLSFFVGYVSRFM
jgi:hypothetical protein